MIDDDRSIVFLDTETTSLDTEGELIEVGWAVGLSPVDSLVLPHTLANADRHSLRVNNYQHRQLWDRSTWCQPEDLYVLRETLAGKTIAAANTPFDAKWLDLLFPDRPWHHRWLDVSSYAACHLGWRTPQSVSDTAQALRERGHYIHVSTHGAADDVRCIRDIWLACQPVG